MNRTRPYVNRFVKRKQQEIVDSYHSTNLKQIKPMTSKLMEHSQTIIINHGKRQMIKQVRQIQIERQNKLLLQKIASVMGKKGAYSVTKTKNIRTKVNKSLNEIYRKRQLQNIQLQNKRFLQRLQNKRPTLNIQKLNKEWVQNKSTIKRMANVDFYLTNIKSTSRVRSITTQRFYKSKYEKMKLIKTVVVDGEKMLIKIEFVGDILKIVGDSQNSRDIKIIQIPKDQAILFIQKDCQGNFELLLQKLKYDAETETLYLVSENLEEDNPDFSDFNPEMDRIAASKEISREKVQSDQRKNKSALHHTNKSIKELSNQSIDPQLQQNKTINVTPQSQSIKKKTIQQKAANLNNKALVKESSKQATKDLQKIEKQYEQHQQIQEHKHVSPEKQKSVSEKQNNEHTKEQKAIHQHHTQKIEENQQAEPQAEKQGQEEIEQNGGQIQEGKEQQQILEQSHKKTQEDKTGAVSKTKIEEPIQKEIIVEPESPEDYNQSFQVSGQVKKAKQTNQVQKKEA